MLHLVLSDAELQRLSMTLEEVQALNPGIKVVRRVLIPPVPATWHSARRARQPRLRKRNETAKGRENVR